MFKSLVGIVVVYLLFHFSVVSIDALIIFKDNLNDFTSIGLFSLASLASLLVMGTYFRFYFCANLFGIIIRKPLLISASSEAYTLGQIIPGQFGIDGLRILKLKELDKTKFKKRLLSATLVEKLASLFTQLFIFSIFIFIIFRVEIDILKLLSILFVVLVSCYLMFRLSKYIIEAKFGIILQNGLGLPFIRIFLFCVVLNLVACSLVYSISEVMIGLEGLSFLKTSVAMLASNIGAAIQITPNGVGLSEFIFSKILSTVGNEFQLDLYGSSYLLYRIFNIAVHLLIYLATILKGSTHGSYSLGK